MVVACHAASRVCPPAVQQRRGALCVASTQQIGHSQPAQQPQEASRRRVLMVVPAVLAAASLGALPANAGVADLLKQNLRGDLDEIDAIVQLLDARGVLYEIKTLAGLPKDSPERKSSNSLLPGYATRLRKLGNAAPTVAGLAAGGDKEAQVSEMYGGEAGTSSITDPVFITVGQILNYSGRGLRDEALANPAFAAAAISAVEDLLAQVPASSMATAVARREATRAARRG